MFYIIVKIDVFYNIVKDRCVVGGGGEGPKISNTIDLSESSTDAGIDRRSKPVEVWKKKHFLRTITVSVDDIHQMPEGLRIR